MPDVDPAATIAGQPAEPTTQPDPPAPTTTDAPPEFTRPDDAYLGLLAMPARLVNLVRSWTTNESDFDFDLSEFTPAERETLVPFLYLVRGVMPQSVAIDWVLFLGAYASIEGRKIARILRGPTDRQEHHAKDNGSNVEAAA